ncbi:MAG: tetratricopeptide repeat protein [Granulosicoccus sp.]|nr:tetratricopeptide repeat protein [Granulosicoccus sp.]
MVASSPPSAGLRHLLPLLMGAALIGCSTIPLGSGTALAQSDAESSPSDASAASDTQTPTDPPVDSQLMFEIMIAELAGRRGQLDVAMAGYLRAAERTDDPRVSERASRLAIFGRQWKEAEKAANRWLKLDPDSKDAPPILAQALLYQGKTDEAASLYLDILEAADNLPLALQQIQFDLQRHDSPEQSLAVLDQILEKYPEEIDVHLAVAQAHLNASDRDSALGAVDAALQIDEDHVAGLLLRGQILSALGRPEEGFAMIQTALEKNPANTSLRLGYAQLLVDSGRFDSVGEELDTLYEADKQNSDTLLAISLLALDSRRFERATVYLNELEARGDHPDHANFYLGRIKDQQQEYEQAIQYYDAVGESDLQLTALIRAAELTAQIGDLEQGRERLHAVSANVANPAMQPRLISAESRMLQQADQSGEAVQVLTEGLERFPDNSDLLYARALTADSAGDSNMLVDDLSRLIQLEPENAHALNALGYYYVDNNVELDKAEGLLLDAIRIEPNDPAIMDSVGWLYYRQGRIDEAVEQLRAAYQLLPDPEIAAHLGEALWVSGAQTEARELVQQALLESPDDANLLRVKNEYIK